MEKKTHCILLVEDEETHAEMVCEALASAGDKFRVTLARSLEEAKTVLADSNIDLVIVDWSLPDGKGLELLPGSLDAATVPMVVMTAHGDEQLAVDAMKAGALDYIVKSSETLANMRHIVEHTLHEWEFIVERKRAEKELLRSEYIVYSSADMMALLDKNFIYLTVNPAYLNAFAKTEEELVGHTVSDVFGEEFFETTIKPNAERCLRGEKVKFQTWVEFPVRGRRYMDTTYSPYIKDKQIEGFVVNGRDITDRKTAEEALLESETRYRDLVEHCQDLVWRINTEGVFTFISPSVKEVLGYTPEEILGMTVAIFSGGLTEKSEEIAREMLKRRLNGEMGNESIIYELTHRRKDGSEFIGEIRSAPLLGKNGEIVGIQGITRDITERKELEIALRESETRFRRLYENTPLAYQSLDIDGNLIEVNTTWLEMLGYERDEVLGHHLQEFLTEDGFVSRNLPRLFNAAEIELPEMGMRCKDGKIKIVHVDGRLSYDQEKNFLQTHCILTDITERKRMAEELIKVEKLESIGVLAGGIAHDLNNFLTGIVGNIGLARMYDDPVEKDKRLQHAEADAMRVKDLTQQLLTFAKGGAPVTKLSNLGALLKETVNFTLSGANVSCDFVLPDDAYLVEIDEGQIRQVINNLIINAQQAMPAGGTIRVSAVNVELDKEDSIPLDAGSYVKISVEDEGAGIPAENRKRIFDPFFTTKPTGSGLGLATAYSIIQKHDGFITVDSEAGAGARFDIYLPASSQKVLDRKAREDAGSLTGEHRILVMDDQENIRELIVLSLNQLGCEVVTSADGTKAIEEYKNAMESGNPFSAVILDLTIPGGMGGSETIEHLKEIDPGVKAIVASGYSDDAIMTNYRDYGFAGAISKPYRIKGLKSVLAEVLNES